MFESCVSKWGTPQTEHFNSVMTLFRLCNRSITDETDMISRVLTNGIHKEFLFPI